MAAQHLYRLMKETMDVADELAQSPETKGCIKWIDDWFDQAWTKALDRLDDAFEKALQQNDARIAEAEAAVYLETLRYYTRRFKEEHHRSRADEILQLAASSEPQSSVASG